MTPEDYEQSEFAITCAIEALMEVQDFGANSLPPHLRALDVADFRTASLGAFVELGELVNECQWKPWRDYGQPTDTDRMKVLKEFADLLHFLAWMLRNLEARFGIEAHDIARAYIQVHLENLDRFNGRVPGREPPVLRDPLGRSLVGTDMMEPDIEGSNRAR